MNISLSSLIGSVRTIPRRQSILTAGAALLALPFAVPAAIAAGRAGVAAADAAPGIEVPMPTASVTLPNGATVCIQAVVGSAGDNEVYQKWDADGSNSATPKASDRQLLSTYRPSPGPGRKVRAIIVETRYVETQQPDFLWGGEDTPDYGRLLTNQPAERSTHDNRYGFEPITDGRGGMAFSTYPAHVVPGRPSAKDAGVRLRYRSDATEFYARNTSHANVQIAVAAGDWSYVFRCPVRPGDTDVSTVLGKVRFNFEPQSRRLSDRNGDAMQGRSLKDSFCVGISDHIRGRYDDFEREVVAVDRDGNVVAFPEMTTAVPGKPEDQANGTLGCCEAVYFPRAALPKIAEFRLLLRPFYTATFHNVALEPKTL